MIPSNATKSEDIITFAFKASDRALEAKYSLKPAQKAELFEGPRLLSTLDAENKRAEIPIGLDESPAIVVWRLNTSNRLWNLIRGDQKGIGITVNNTPVRKTIDDPDTYLPAATTALKLFLLLAALRAVFAYVLDSQYPGPFLENPIGHLAIILPLAASALAFFLLESRRKIALPLGLFAVSYSAFEYTAKAVYCWIHPELEFSFFQVLMVLLRFWMFFSILGAFQRQVKAANAA